MHKELVEVGYKWLLKNGGCGVAFKELKSINQEIPDVIGFSSHYSYVIECKVSRTDFLKDKKKPHRAIGMGDFRYFLCPAGLIKHDELPDKWGLIYCYPNGKILTVKRVAGIKAHQFDKDRFAEQRLMYTALRRLFIKGYFPSIYDKDYKSNKDVNHLIELNSNFINPNN